MTGELMKGNRERMGLYLDPRTKMITVLTISTVMLGSGNAGFMIWIKPVLMALPVLLLFSAGKWKRALGCLAAYGLALYGEHRLLSLTGGGINFILVALSGFITRFMPGIIAGYYMVSTTTVSEFMAAMERMHVTEKISIPMSVMFRFFPTVTQEYSSINDAMRMRGILLGGKHPGKILEYRLVPLLASCVKIGEELSAAALTRGLGAPVKRTNICKIGFHMQDAVTMLVCLTAAVYFVIYKLQVIKFV